MKNHPVNNDYVQNLIEGLINEADYAEVQTESRRGAPGSAKARIQDADSERRRENSQEVLNHEVDADNGDLGRRTDDWEDESLHGTGGSDRKPKKVRGAKNEKPATHNRGATTKRPIGNSDYAKDPATTKMYLKLAKERAARKLKKVEEAVVSEANYPLKTGLSRGVDVDNRKKLAGHLRKTRNAPDADSAAKSARDTMLRPRFNTSDAQEKVVDDATDKAFQSNPNKDKGAKPMDYGKVPKIG